MNGFSPQSARSTAPTAFVNNTSVAMTQAVNNQPSVANTALAKLDNKQLEKVRQLRTELVKADPKQLVNYGAGVQDEIAKMADEVLGQTKSRDLEMVGSKLTEIIMKAKGINVGIDDKSKVPLIGGLINKFRNTRDRVVGQFDATVTQVEKIVTEVDSFSAALKKSLDVQERLYEANLRQYQELDVLVVAGRMAMEDLQKQTDNFVANLGPNPDPYDVQQVSDAKTYLTNLDMTVSNLERLKISSYQTAPTVRMMQQNGIQLIEKFKLVKTQVVPQWKRQFMITLMVEEQKRGVELDNMITDASNDMAMQTATMLKQTSVAVAKANQRGVLDLTTLEHVQNELISGIDEVLKITEEGSQHRKLVSQRVGELQNELQNKLTKGNN